MTQSSVDESPFPEPETVELAGCAELLDQFWSLGTSTDSSAMPTSIGRFRLEQVLGVGGFGIVYRAYDPAMQRQIALKVPRLHSLASEKLLARFEREARLAGSLDHPNIVPIYETGHVGPLCYIAQALCAGPNLREWLKVQTSPVPLGLVAALVSKLAEAVHYSHSRGVLHCDLKPSNVLLVWTKGEPSEPRGDELPFVPRLTDFGIAKIFGDNSHESPTLSATLVVGTLSYMAPEQTGDSEFQFGPEIDVYGLGSILYELLTGRPPFQGAGVVNLIEQVRTIEPVAPRQLRGDISADLETICLKCLEKSPTLRFPTAQDLKADLDRYLRGEPIHSRPINSFGRLQRWCRKKPAKAILLGVSVSSLITIAGLFAAHYRNVTSFNDRVSKLNLKLTVAVENANVLRHIAEENENKAKDGLYVADVTRAVAAWKHDDTRTLNEALENHIPKSGAIDRRGFEWYYLRRQGRQSNQVLLNIGSPVYYLCPSADFSVIAAAGKDANVRLFDSLTGRVVQEIPTGQIEVNGLAFLPDGQELATAGDDGTIRFWNLKTGSERLRINVPRTKAYQMVVKPDGREIAMCGDNPVIRVFDVHSGELRQKILQHKEAVQSLVLGFERKIFASGSSDGTVFLWNLRDWSRITTFDFIWRGAIGPVVLREDRDFIIIGSDNGDVTSRKVLTNVDITQTGDFENTESLALTPNGDLLALGNSSGRIRFKNVSQQGELTGSTIPPWQAHQGSVVSMVWSPDSSRLISTGEDGRVMSWSQHLFHTPNPRRIETAVFSRLYLIPQTDCLFAIDEDPQSSSSGRVAVVDLRATTRVCLQEIDRCHELAVSHDGRFVAGLRRLSNHEELQLFEVRKTNGTVTGLCSVETWNTPGKMTDIRISPDAKQVAVSHWQHPNPEEPPEHFIKLFCLPDLKSIETIPASNGKIMAYSPNGKYAALAANSGIVLWDLEERRPVWEVPQRHINNLVFSPDGGLIATVGDDRLVVVRNANNGTIRFQLAGHRAKLFAINFSPDGRTLATSDFAGTLKLWNVNAGQELFEVNNPGTLSYDVSFSSDGRRLFLGVRPWTSAQKAEILIFDASEDHFY
jgi:serine/threonine protein kinase/WD40 repeat protein